MHLCREDERLSFKKLAQQARGRMAGWGQRWQQSSLWEAVAIIHTRDGAALEDVGPGRGSGVVSSRDTKSTRLQMRYRCDRGRGRSHSVGERGWGRSEAQTDKVCLRPHHQA